MTDTRLHTLLDRAAVTDVVLRFAHAFDMADWPMLRGCFTDEITVDYTDFRGEPETTLPADEFVASRRTLAHLKTHHLLTGHLVTMNVDEAECLSNFVIYRYDPALAEHNAFDTHGYYIFRLRRLPEGWRIRYIKQSVLWSSGNPLIHGAHRRE